MKKTFRYHIGYKYKTKEVRGIGYEVIKTKSKLITVKHFDYLCNKINEKYGYEISAITSITLLSEIK